MISTALMTVVNTLNTMGGKVYIVGGAVRDYVLYGKFTADIDLEVFNISGEQLLAVLSTFGKVVEAGKFSIFTLTVDGMKYDFSLPRRERKIGTGYTAFNIIADPSMTVEEASARRDFTINAMMLELPSMKLIDPHGGVQDLIDGILRPTSERFIESAERVLRGFQFTSRFGFTMDEKAILFSRAMFTEAKSIDRSMLWKQFSKWAHGMFPHVALQELVRNGWLTLFPTLSDMLGVQQDPMWHPEGDVWEHTKFVVKAMSEIIRRQSITDEDTIHVLMLTALLHDVGKPSTTAIRNGRITSHGHAEAGIDPATTFLDQIGAPHRIRNRILPLIREHMAHIGMDVNAKSVRKLALRLQPATIDDLMLVINADHSGRPPLKSGLPDKAMEIWKLSKAIQVTSEVPKRIIQGRHLIELGLSPHSSFRSILDAAFEAQIGGEFDTVEGGKLWISSLLKNQT